MLRRNGIQLVLRLSGTGRPEEESVGRWVRANEAAIARLQVGRLAAAGHQRLGYAMPVGERLTESAALRLEMLQQACAEFGLPAPDARKPAADPIGAAEVVAAWRTQTPPVTGICAHDLDAAVAVLAGLRQQGLRAPDGLAVIGVNDAAVAALTDPPLTMVAVDWNAIADRLVGLVVELLAGHPAEPAQHPEVTQVIERASV